MFKKSAEIPSGPGAEPEGDPGLDNELPGVLDQDVILDEVGRVGEGEDAPVTDPRLTEHSVCPDLTTEDGHTYHR